MTVYTINRLRTICSHWQTERWEVGMVFVMDYRAIRKRSRRCKICRTIKDWLQIQFSAGCEERPHLWKRLDRQIKQSFLLSGESTRGTYDFEIKFYRQNCPVQLHHGDLSMVIEA